MGFIDTYHLDKPAFIRRSREEAKRLMSPRPPADSTVLTSAEAVSMPRSGAGIYTSEEIASMLRDAIEHDLDTRNRIWYFCHLARSI